MRKLTVGTLVSLDGVFDSPRSWASAYFDDEAAEISLAKLMQCDAMLMGRATYDYFAPAWPAAAGEYAARVNAIPKYVFSSTLATASWSNAEIVRGDAVAAVRELKAAGDGDLVVYGYGRFSQALLEAGLVDELSFWVHPVVLGAGLSMFRPGARVPLRLLSAQVRASGVVALAYAPD